MIQDRRWCIPIVVLCVVGLVTGACGPAGGAETPEPTPPASAVRGQCGVVEVTVPNLEIYGVLVIAGAR